MSYKIMFLDIDGTLTNSKKEITPATKKALISAQKKGFKIAIASGRPDNGVAPIAKELELDRFGGYILSFNGGRIREFGTGKAVFEKNLHNDIFRTCCMLAKEYGVEILTYEGNTLITENGDNKFLKIEAKINKLSVKVVENISEYADFDIPKCLMLGEGNYMAEVEKKVKNVLGDTANVFRSEPFFLEIMPKNIDKATSISKLIDKLGISREEAIACGDGYNDVSMIKYAGLGVAMENACDAAKSAADYITYSNENDGIAHVVEKFIC